jgi:hypothetical protein
VTKIEFTRKLLLLEKELDQVRAENLRLRDRVLAAAAACESCSGTGLVSIFEQIDPDDITKGCREAVQECGDCADWREALGQ